MVQFSRSQHIFLQQELKTVLRCLCPISTHRSMKRHNSVTFFSKLATLAAYFRCAFVVSVKSPCHNKASRKKNDDVLLLSARKRVSCMMEPGVLVDLHPVFIIQAPAVSSLHREAKFPKHQYSLMSRALEKTGLPPVQLSLLNNSIFSHPLPQPLCPVYGYLLDVLTSHKNADFMKLMCWRIVHTPVTKTLIHEDLTVGEENETRTMTQAPIILPKRIVQIFKD